MPATLVSRVCFLGPVNIAVSVCAAQDLCKCSNHVLIKGTSLNPQSPQASVCCHIGAAALVHFRPGEPGLPSRGFKIAAVS